MLVTVADTFAELEETLTSDLLFMSKDWRLTPNPDKSEVSVLHLNNCEANRTINVTFNGVNVRHNLNKVYLGLKFDRILTFKEHLDGLSRKLASRVNIVRNLAVSGWGHCSGTPNC